MKWMRLTDFPVKNLQYVFAPVGLPLVAKGEDEHGTTTILIRGGAGTGKTTLALALAHAIAKMSEGLVLYLTAEFSPAEIAFKATLIGLSESAVDAWPGEAAAPAGSVVVAHLVDVPRKGTTLSSVERKKGAIDAVWGLLHPEKEGGQAPALPIRVVVIDAFTLPDDGADEAALRTDVVAFLQAIENEGISAIVVEEVGPGAYAWPAFVVDVVFELAFAEDQDTHELRRKLSCTKCRYSFSLPGPHDYGLESRVPAVWPDLFRVVRGPHGSPFGGFIVTPAGIAIPLEKDNQWLLLKQGIIVSDYTRADQGVIHLLQKTPGMAWIEITCGSTTTIHDRPGSRVGVFDDEGVHAIGWGILRLVKETGANLCVVDELDSLLGRAGQRAHVIHLLESLRQVGLLVYIHTRADMIAQLLPIVDYVWNGKYRGAIKLPARRHLSAARWLVTHGLPLSQRKETEFQASLRLQLDNARDLVDRGSLDRAKQILDDISTQIFAQSNLFALAPPNLPDQDTNFEPFLTVPVIPADERSVDPPAPRVHVEHLRVSIQLALVLDRLGARGGRDIMRSVLASFGTTAPEWPSIAATALLLGADWEVGRHAIQAVSAESTPDLMIQLWHATCATHVGNRAAISILAKSADRRAHVWDPMLRGLAHTDQIDEADRIIGELGPRHAIEPWMLERLRADTRLDAVADAAVSDAAARLEALANRADIPVVHRAESLHNLGVARDRLGQHEAAVACFQQAQRLNPYLDAAQQEAKNLATPNPPTPAQEPPQ